MHIFSENEGIDVRTNKLSDKKEFEAFIALKADLVVVIAYGQIIPEMYLKIPNLIFLNVHASLLPKWRGAAPIERAILSKESETGISIMKIEKKLDAGPFIKQVKVKIDKDSTSGELVKKLSIIGAEALKESIDLVSLKKANFIKQNEKEATYANKIEKSESEIKWNLSANKIVSKINALNPSPGAWFYHKGTRLKIIQAEVSDLKGVAGKILDDKLIIGCLKSSLKVKLIQKEGKKILNTKEFLSGYKIKKNDVLN